MERVAFLIEGANERIGCLLNPENLVLRRSAGIRPRALATGQLSGSGLSDDPLLFTGGGRTEIDLDLLFDISLAGSSIRSEDVRDYTAPLWRLAENATLDGQSRPPTVRFIWGKTWNIPGVVTAVAERLEQFTPAGVPQRSWLRLRLLRVDADAFSPRSRSRLRTFSPENLASVAGEVSVHQRLSGNVVSLGAFSALHALKPPSLSVLESLITASDIIQDAVAGTPIGAKLIAYARQLKTLVSETYKKIADWITAPSDRPALKAIRNALSHIREAADNLARAASERFQALLTQAKAKLDAALETISNAGGKVTKPIRAKLTKAINAVLANVRPIARALPEAAGIVAAAVKVKAARAIAILTPAIARGWEEAKSVLSAAGKLATEAGRTAIEAAKKSAAVIGQALEKLKSAGEIIPIKQLGPALDKLMDVADRLWSTGGRAAGALLGKATAGLVRFFKNLAETGKALASVSAHAAAQAMAASIAGLKSALKATGAEAGHELLDQGGKEALHGLNAALDMARSLVHSDRLTPIQKSVAVLHRQLAQRPAGSEESPQIEKKAAQTIAALTKRLAQFQSEATASLAEVIQQAAQTKTPIADARSDAPSPSPVAPPQQPAPTSRFTFGERLDDLAFRYYGDPRLWRALAIFNHISDPLHMAPGQLLRFPPLQAG